MKNFFLIPNSDIVDKLKSFKIRSKLSIPKTVRLINKYLYKYFLIGAILNRYDNSISFYSAKNDNLLYKDYSKNSVFVNFGSGAFSHYRWINFDLPAQSEYYKKIQGTESIDFNPIDLCDDNLKIPLENDSCDLIYCSHTLEHIEDQKGFNFIRECKRILKKDGILRVALPNTDNNFFFCKIFYSQESISEDIKKNLILKAAHEVLSETENLEDKIVIEKVIESGFQTSIFVDNILKDFKYLGQFKKNNPGRHITYYSHEKLLKISKALRYNSYLPMYKGSSLAEPFKNIDVFDATESQWSIYGEFIK